MPLSEADYDSIYEAAEALLCMRQFDAAVKLYDAVVKARPNLAGGRGMDWPYAWNAWEEARKARQHMNEP